MLRPFCYMEPDDSNREQPKDAPVDIPVIYKVLFIVLGGVFCYGVPGFFVWLGVRQFLHSVEPDIKTLAILTTSVSVVGLYKLHIVFIQQCRRVNGRK